MPWRRRRWAGRLVSLPRNGQPRSRTSAVQRERSSRRQQTAYSRWPTAGPSYKPGSCWVGPAGRSLPCAWSA
eukprot:14976229-Alexandrium_andersonii.AAC.1